MFSEKSISDESNEAASLAIINVRKDKADTAADTSHNKSGDITERLVALSQEMDRLEPSDPIVPLSDTDRSLTACSLSKPNAQESHIKRTPAEARPQYRGWRKAENPDDLLSYWAALRQGQKYPSRQKLQTDRIGKFWPNCLLVDCNHDSGRMQLDYEFTKALRQVQARQDADGTNAAKIEVNAMVIDWVFAQCQDVAMSGRPNHASEVFPTHSGESNIRLIALPLSKDQRQIDFILCHLQEI